MPVLAGVAADLVCTGGAGVSGLPQPVRVASTANSAIEDDAGRWNDSFMGITGQEQRKIE
ncbi:hypothetical protein NCPPB1935_02920 [Xanthomonas campestris pv. nigromaculans]|nr:hypothetical protein NCPPB1935_02920 [Xanthomonas campestris pv. nigromaculans]